MRIIVWRIFRINHDVLIVIGRSRIVAPDVRLCYLMVRIIGSSRQIGVVTENLADLKNAGGREGGGRQHS